MNTNTYIELQTPFDDDRPVFLAGDFCDWYPDVPKYALEKIKPGTYRFPIPKEWMGRKMQYKYTKGGWEHVELDALGNPAPNRIWSAIAPTQQHDLVPQWRNQGKTPQINRFLPKIQLISEQFHMPQLDKSRTIQVLLPHNYEENPEKRYPVLYMQDAQNLFGQGSAYGNWEIDKRLSLSAAQGKGDLIVVAIHHGEEDRFLEYTPYKNKGKGQGMKYATFLVRTLKPYIDQHFRTLPDRAHTGIGGSSMGGLLSIYAGFMYPEIMGRLLVFSPSLWVSPKIYFDAVEFFHPLQTKIYLYGGGKEGSYMVENMEKLKQTITQQGFDSTQLQVQLVVDPTGEHQEKRWGQEFPKAVEWLFS